MTCINRLYFKFFSIANIFSNIENKFLSFFINWMLKVLANSLNLIDHSIESSYGFSFSFFNTSNIISNSIALISNASMPLIKLSIIIISAMQFFQLCFFSIWFSIFFRLDIFMRA